MLLCIASLGAKAEENFRFSGFGTLGLVQTDSSYYGYRSDVSYEDGTFKGELDLGTTSIFGIQPEYHFNDRFDFVSQFVYRNQNNFSFDSALRMAFLRYNPTADLSIRVGRTAIDIFRLSEYTDIGFAYPWAKAPTEVYGLITYRHLDGIDATKTFQLDASTLRAKVIAGESKADQSSYLFSEEVKIGDFIGFSLEWEATDWILKGNFSTTHVENDNTATSTLSSAVAQLSPTDWPNNLEYAQELSLVNKDVRYASLGGTFFFSDWRLITEFSNIESDSIFIGPTNNGYVSAVYSFNNHEFFASYSFVRSKYYNFDQPIDRNGPYGQLIAEIELAGSFLNATQKSVSIGWRWNVSERVAIKTQFERTDIAHHGSALWLSKNNLVAPPEIVNAFYLNTSFIF